MGIFAKRSSSKKNETSSIVTPEPTDLVENARQRRKFLASNASRFSRTRKQETPATEVSVEEEETPGILDVLDIDMTENGGDFEIMTPESRKALSRQQEEVKKQLFGSDDDARVQQDKMDRFEGQGDVPRMRRVATSFSQEVTREGMILDAFDYENAEDIKISRFASSPIEGIQNMPPLDLDKDTTTPNNAAEDVQQAEEGAVNEAKSIVPKDPPKVPEEEPIPEAPETKADENLVTPEAAKPTTRPKVENHSFAEEKKDSVGPGEYYQNDEDDGIKDTSGADFRPFEFNDDDLESVKPTRFNPQTLFKVLKCNEDTTVDGCRVVAEKFKVADLFYDRICHPMMSREKHRPFYDEEFTLDFLRQMMTQGVTLLHLQPPASPNNPTLDWNGRSVSMMIESGTTGDNQDIQPKLEWTTIAGGQTFEVSTTSVSLLSILSINSKASEEEKEEYDSDEVCFFTVTTNKGDVHIFEANSVSERDRIVNGLRNVIARLSYHLISGDVTAASELYKDDALPEKGANPAELPTLAKPQQAMNRLSHALLD